MERSHTKLYWVRACIFYIWDQNPIGKSVKIINLCPSIKFYFHFTQQCKMAILTYIGHILVSSSQIYKIHILTPSTIQYMTYPFFKHCDIGRLYYM